MYERNIVIIPIALILKAFYSVEIGIPFHPWNPDQIHLSLGDLPEDMVVTWITFIPTGDPYVWYEDMSDGQTQMSRGFSTEFKDRTNSRIVRYIHRVVLQCLKPNTFYEYRCGGFLGVSTPRVFKTSPRGTDWSPKLIIYGDMGWNGAAVLPFIENETKDFKVDAIVHVGDIAYNMDSCDGFVGDEFLRMIEPVASRIPYMTAVGNHERKYNFSYYKNKFTMPGDSEGLYYSFDLGPAHFVAISSEVYYFTEYGVEPLVNQFNWLLRDLKKAGGIENKNQRPWLIIFSHRPMYCSSDTKEDCSLEKNVLRRSDFNSHTYGLEYLFHINKADVMFSGHMHYYERSYPLYNSQVYNGSCEEPYRNPGANVHIITGAAGMKCGTESASYVRRDWFPFFSSEYSYTMLTVKNKTHLHIEQISAITGEVMDSIWLIKDKSD